MAFVTRAACQPETSQKVGFALAGARNDDGQPVAAAASAGKFGFEVGGVGVGGTLLVGEGASGNTKTSEARLEIVLPQNYEPGSAVSLRVHARVDLVLNTAATIDAEVYMSDDEGGVSADLNTTAAQNVNSATFTTLVFAINGASLSPGDTLEIYLVAVANDSGGTTNGRIEIGSVWLVTTTRM